MIQIVKLYVSGMRPPRKGKRSPVSRNCQLSEGLMLFSQHKAALLLNESKFISLFRKVDDQVSSPSSSEDTCASSHVFCLNILEACVTQETF